MTTAKQTESPPMMRVQPTVLKMLTALRDEGKNMNDIKLEFTQHKDGTLSVFAKEGEVYISRVEPEYASQEQAYEAIRYVRLIEKDLVK